MDTFDALLDAFGSYYDARMNYNNAKMASREAYFVSDERDLLDRMKKRLAEALEVHIKHVVAVRELP